MLVVRAAAEVAAAEGLLLPLMELLEPLALHIVEMEEMLEQEDFGILLTERKQQRLRAVLVTREQQVMLVQTEQEQLPLILPLPILVEQVMLVQREVLAAQVIHQ
jgi:hypothetical protein